MMRNPAWLRRVALFCAVLFVCAVGWAQVNPLMSISDAAAAEGNSGTTNLVFSVSLSEPSADTVSAEYFTVPVSATPGADYLSTTGLVTFLPGQTSATINVAIIGDTLNEPDEVLWVFLQNATNAIISDNRGDGTIVNDDPPPTLNISNVTVGEGNTGTTNAIFQVNLSAPSGQTVSAEFFTSGLTATAGQDFVAASSSFTLNPGETNFAISITINGDTLNEIDETFALVLTNVVNASPTTNQGICTIIDDDPLPAISIADVSVVEGTGGSNAAVFAVTLTPPSGRMVSVNFATASGSATAGSDFTPTNGTLFFTAGVTNQFLTIPITTDSAIETTETFGVSLSNPTNATLSRSQATGTIIDDELRTLVFTNAAPVSIPLQGAASVYPSTIELSGIVGTVVKVTATLSGLSHGYPDDLDILLVGPAGQNVMLMSDCGENFSINNTTLTFDDAAVASLPDATQISSGTFKPTNQGLGVDILAGPAPSGPFGSAFSTLTGVDPNGTWSLYVFDDSPGDGGYLARGWQLSLTLSNLVCCTGGNADLSVIVSDSPDPLLTTSNVTYTARIINNGPAAATGVTLTNLLPAGMNLVSATTSQGTLTTNASVITGNLGTMNLGAQVTVAIVATPTTFGTFTNTMTARSDNTDPNPTNNTALTPTTVNQLAPLVQIANAAVAEGDGGRTNLVFPVTLSRSNNVTVSVDYSTADGSAIAGSDYITTSGTLMFSPGATNATIAVPVTGDISVEANETLLLQLSNPTNGLLASTTVTGTIVNDDGLLNQLYQFAWNSVSSPQYAGAPFPVTISARDFSNNPAAFTGVARLTGLVGSGPEVSVVISEIDTGDSDRVEFANVAGSPQDVSGWRVSIYDWLSWPDPEFTFALPTATTCGANEVFVLADNGTAPGAYPNFFSGANAFWSNDETNNMVAVLLQDADGRIVDFVCAFDASPGDISNPVSIPASEWTSAPIPANTDNTLVFLRNGNSDSNSSTDWSVGSPSFGLMNSGLTLPFAGTRPILVTPSLASNFVNGVWAGNLSVSQAATNLMLRARDFVGHAGLSNPFNVQNSANLTITGLAIPSAVPANQNLTFSLTVSNGGPSSASSVMLTNVLPTAANFVSANSNQGTNSRVGNTLMFNLGNLAVGAVATANVTAKFSTGGVFTNNAQATASLPDPATADNSLALIVHANSAPVFSPVSTQTIAEGNTLFVTNSAVDPDSPPNNLTFTLLVAPTAATLATNGVLTWTTTETNGPSTNLVTVRVTDDGVPSLSATQSFSVIVTEVNSAPTLNPIPNQTIDEGTTLTIPLSATDPDVPTNTLTFSLVSGPASATVNSGGLFNWTTTELDGPGTNIVSVRVQDNGTPSLSATQSFFVIVREVNSAPAFTPMTNRFFATVGNTLFVTNSATDSDVPTNRLTFTLLTGPTNSVLTTNGLFSWQPAFNQASTTNAVSLRVSDNGTPSLSATQNFLVVVSAPAGPIIIDGIRTISGLATINFTTEAGYAYTIETRAQSSTNGWVTASSFTNPPVAASIAFADLIAAQSQRFYRVRNLTVPYQTPRISGLIASGGVFRFGFSADAGRTYAIESRSNLVTGAWLSLTNYAMPAVTSNFTFSAVPQIFGQPQEYRVVRFSLPVPSQRLDGIARNGSNVQLRFTAIPGLPYVIERSDSLATANWTTLASFGAASALTNVVLTDSSPGVAQRFYRLKVVVPAANVSLTQTNVPDRVDLSFTARAGVPYTLQSRAAFQSGNWLDLLTVIPQSTNTPMVLSDTNVFPVQKFYRLRSP